MAQEIQRQLEELEVKQRELERRGVSVEKALRGEGSGTCIMCFLCTLMFILFHSNLCFLTLFFTPVGIKIDIYLMVNSLSSHLND